MSYLKSFIKFTLHWKIIVETELDAICKEILGLLENNLIKLSEGSAAPDADEARVFYLKMTGDYYRYLAEFANQKDSEGAIEVLIISVVYVFNLATLVLCIL